MSFATFRAATVAHVASRKLYWEASVPKQKGSGFTPWCAILAHVRDHQLTTWVSQELLNPWRVPNQAGLWVFQIPGNVVQQTVTNKTKSMLQHLVATTNSDSIVTRESPLAKQFPAMGSSQSSKHRGPDGRATSARPRGANYINPKAGDVVGVDESVNVMLHSSVGKVI